MDKHVEFSNSLNGCVCFVGVPDELRCKRKGKMLRVDTAFKWEAFKT